MKSEQARAWMHAFLIGIAVALILVGCSSCPTGAHISKLIDMCIKENIRLYGDLIGEDPNQNPENIVLQTGEAIKLCVEDGL